MPLHAFVSIAFAMSAQANPLSRPDAQLDGKPDGKPDLVAVSKASVDDAVRNNLQQVESQSQPIAADLASSVRSLVVTATAYNSLVAQTDSDPTTAAWGDALAPGMKAIAVSRDLIPLGLDHRAPVSIEGLSGKYRVLDKMNGRWSKRIDIYMGNDVNAALAWGRREVRIHW